MASQPTLLGACAVVVALRVLNALCVRTYAAPDEWWQAPEIAHRLVYGRGHVTWEWWPPFEIRSALHPFLISWALAAAGRLGLADSWWTVSLVPRLIHALLASGTDVSTFYLARELTGSTATAWLALAVQVASWFNAFGLVRPFTNSLEACLVTCGLCLWIRGVRGIERGAALRTHAGSLVLGGLCAGLACAVRPTALITWAVVGAGFFATHGVQPMALVVAALGVAPAAASFFLGAWLDALLYGRWTATGVNFLRVNALQGLDRLYGAYPAHWYLVDGLPAACGAALPLVLLGLTQPGCGLPTALVAANVAALSCAGHKEHRFLLPVSPLLSILAGAGLRRLQLLAGDGRGSGGGERREGAGQRPPGGRPPCVVRALFPASLTLLAVTGFGVSLYINTVHQRGPVAVMEELAVQAEAASRVAVAPNNDSGAPLAAVATDSGRPPVLSDFMALHVLGPCHATPFHALLHTELGDMWQLDCSPPQARAWLAAAQRRGYVRGGGQECAMRRAIEGGDAVGPNDSDLWKADPAAALRTFYGTTPGDVSLPLMCGVTPAGTARISAARWPAAGKSAAPIAGLPLPELTSVSRPPWTSALLPASLLHTSDAPRRLPSHIVMSDADAAIAGVAAWLQDHGYREVARHFHSHFRGDVHAAPGRESGAFLLLQHRRTPSTSPYCHAHTFRTLPRMDMVGSLVGTALVPGKACCDTVACDVYAADINHMCYLYVNVTQLVPSSMMASGVREAVL